MQSYASLYIIIAIITPIILAMLISIVNPKVKTKTPRFNTTGDSNPNVFP